MYKRFGDLTGKLVFDIGANVGDYTRYFKERGASVVAVEPQKELTENNDAFAGVVCENKCVSNSSGEITLFECDAHTIATCSIAWKTAGRFRGSPWNKSRVVPCVTIKDLVSKYGKPYAIKIDVEGLEDKVIEGMDEKVEVLVFEYTQEFYDKAIECLRRLKSLGYTGVYCYPMNKENSEIDFGGDFAEVEAYLRSIAPGAMGDFLLV